MTQLKRPRRSIEAAFMNEVIRWARLNGCAVYHHPDEGQRIIAQAAKSDGRRWRAMPVKGFPDLTIVRADPPLLVFAELKGPRGSLTDEQKEWIASLEAVAGIVGPPLYVRVWKPKDWPEIETLLSR